MRIPKQFEDIPELYFAITKALTLEDIPIIASVEVFDEYTPRDVGRYVGWNPGLRKAYRRLQQRNIEDKREYRESINRSYSRAESTA